MMTSMGNHGLQLSHNHQHLGSGLYACPDYTIWPSHRGIYLFVFHWLCRHQVCQMSLIFLILFSRNMPKNFNVYV